MTEKGDGTEDVRAAIRAAFENAAHSSLLENMRLDRKKFPEIEAVIKGEMTFDEAAKSIATRYTEC